MWSWCPLYNHHMKTAEPFEPHNRRERRERSRDGVAGSSEKATPGLLRQAPGVAFSFKGCEPSLAVQCEDPSALRCSSRPEALTHFQRRVYNHGVKYSHSAVSSINHVLISLFTTYHSELSIKGNFVYLEMFHQLLFIHTRCFIRLRERQLRGGGFMIQVFVCPEGFCSSPSGHLCQNGLPPSAFWILIEDVWELSRCNNSYPTFL